MHGAQRMQGALKIDIQAAQTKGAQAIFKELEPNLGAVVAAVPADVCGREVTCHSPTSLGLSECSKYSNGKWVSSQHMWGRGRSHVTR